MRGILCYIFPRDEFLCYIISHVKCSCCIFLRVELCVIFVCCIYTRVEFSCFSLISPFVLYYIYPAFLKIYIVCLFETVSSTCVVVIFSVCEILCYIFVLFQRS